MITSKDISIVLCGPAGQGIQTAEKILVSVFKRANYCVFATKEYMSRVRGGSNSITIRISSEKIRAVTDRIDILIPLDQDAFQHVQHRISPQTVIIGEKDRLLERKNSKYGRFIDVPLSKLAREIGGIIYLNMIVVGVIVGLLEIEKTIVRSYVKAAFGQKKKEVIERNIEAIDVGLEIGFRHRSELKFDLPTKKGKKIQNEMLVNGAEAVGMGAVAGGCNFVASYPMSPSTAVLTFVAQHSKEFGIIAEQAEDEIAAINMTLGAWYAGARGMVTTSGGGFALMAEGLSLAGMLETPLVIHLAQRPGPATGLPTRTEQGDLAFAVHAGHGEFPRVIFAPGTLEDGFYLTQKAFNIADRFQIPVFILTDQYFMDSYYTITKFDLSKINNHNYVIKTSADYKRFALTENGISPRGIPGYGDGLVVVDSDEHDEEGHITENLQIRTKMVNKRLKKMEALVKEALLPEYSGPENYDTLVICWGSTAPIVAEAVQGIKDKRIGLLYFKQVYPISLKAGDFIKRSKKVIVIESNATAQFTRILKNQFPIDTFDTILKYDGLAFTVEEITQRLMEATT